jgi:hypothetical protein
VAMADGMVVPATQVVTADGMVVPATQVVTADGTTAPVILVAIADQKMDPMVATKVPVVLRMVLVLPAIEITMVTHIMMAIPIVIMTGTLIKAITTETGRDVETTTMIETTIPAAA